MWSAVGRKEKLRMIRRFHPQYLMENSEGNKCRCMYVVRGRRKVSEFEHIPFEIPGYCPG